ncbi:DNA alkylation repair protein [Moheibacter sediminis]|uniref:3-methyladenine DNA glycosylase AlkC n=1 Tax=Moheibacter sediminis TaxID=1434700 RepID=A0A1W2BVN7_9FLAO|nr:DNA alkylation repair protein [Moheibacter sediminis]SMC77027.1 3-methyladenine DNA glycosylase AlkC [Moheibacter sediminis]
MSSLLKDIYSPLFYENFSNVLLETVPGFDKENFISSIFDDDWNERELKSRMKHTATVLYEFMPKDFEAAGELIQKIILKIKEKPFTNSSFPFMFFPEYIEKYGLDYFEISVKLIETVTQFISCEFTVRPFIIRYGNEMISKMTEWSIHENHHVRRLASEGSRPRLPWAISLPELKKNPSPILPLLENLKNDSSEYVRRSVANSLNDISKDNPQVTLSIAKKWKGLGKETDAIIKHGSRTLLKQGNTEIMSHYGLVNSDKVFISDFELVNSRIKIGDYLEFSFKIENQEENAVPVRLEYGIYYLRQNGSWSKKVFKISERILLSNEILIVSRKQSFKIITTRKFYGGIQKISIIVNGHERCVEEFEIIGQ